MSKGTAFRGHSVLSATDTLDNDASCAVGRAFARVRSWRAPCNWSARDWIDEAQAITVAAGWRAKIDYDAGRCVPLSAFIYRRAITSTWTRYRQEWAYCSHTASEAPKNGGTSLRWSETSAADEMSHRELSEAFARLSRSEQWLIQQIFWQGATQASLALILRISQQAVSRRKTRALKHLRRLLDGEHRNHCIAKLMAAFALLDQALDFFPVLDCGL